jgi:hypothetical protein
MAFKFKFGLKLIRRPKYASKNWIKKAAKLRLEDKTWKEISDVIGLSVSHICDTVIKSGLLPSKSIIEHRNFSYIKKGSKINFFTVIRKIPNKRNTFEFQCICGKKTIEPLWKVIDRKQSCGCKTNEILSRKSAGKLTNHDGATKIYPREYKSYSCMLRRCYSKDDVNYINYGGRGIKVCDRWKNGEKRLSGFQCFIKDMRRKPDFDWSLDRIESDKNYNPKNCRWANKWLQANNKRRNIWKKFENKQITLEHLCKVYNLDITRAKKYIKQNGNISDILNLNKTFLSLDPGSANFAYCVIKENKVTRTGLLNYPIKEITSEDIVKFIDEITELFEEEKPDIIVAERFMIRRFLSPIVEKVGFSLGIIYSFCYKHDIKVNLITSSQWKLAIKNFINLDKLYKESKEKFKIPPHIIDAMCMGRYIMGFNSFKKEDVEWIEENLPRCCKDM